MVDNRCLSKSVCLKSEVYVFAGYKDNDNWLQSIEKYIPSNNSWIKVADMNDGRTNYSACGFMDNIYIIGGFSDSSIFNMTVYNSCLEFYKIITHKL